LALYRAIITRRLPFLRLNTDVYTNDNDHQVDQDCCPILTLNMLDYVSEDHLRFYRTWEQICCIGSEAVILTQARRLSAVGRKRSAVVGFDFIMIR